MRNKESFKTLFSKYVFQFDKIKYFVNKNKFTDKCILCEILKNDVNKENNSLLILSSRFISVCVNLYPYNSGHIMLFPVRHLKSFLEMTEDENYHLFILTKFFIEAINYIYNPSGYNIGMNIGKNSGASIEHIHQHIVPRFENELGMIDIIGGSKVLVEPVNITKDKLSTYSEKMKTNLPFEIMIYR